MKPKNNTYQRYGNFIINKSEPLGSGNFGHVWKGYLINAANNLQPVAIKQSYNQTQNIKEIQTLQILNHPNIIQYRDYRISGNSVFMVMELCEGGTLDDLLYRMQVHDTNKILGYFSQVINGIKFMYDKKILHRDIKPSNLLVTKKNIIKIADFGTSKMNRSSEMKLKTLVGTPLFFSPQLFQMSFGQEDTYTEKSQIWALGLILYFMFNFQYDTPKAAQRMKQSLPWSGKTTLQIFKNIKSQPLVFKKSQRIPQQIKQIIKRMLKIDAKQRMSFQQLFSIQIFFKPNISYLYQIPQTLSQSLSQSSQNTLLAPTQQKTLIPITRETIDWQLLQILQRKDQQNNRNQQIEEYALFYQLVLKQLSQAYEIQYYDLMFQLQYRYYSVTEDQKQKERIKSKYFQKQQMFKQIDINERKQSSLIGNMQKNPSIIKNQSHLMQSFSKNLLQIPLPSQNLVRLSKNFIKLNLSKILPIKSGTIYDDKLKDLIFLIYDLLTLITFQKSWEIKRKTKATIFDYKQMRKLVKIQNILARISRALQVIKL